MSGIYLITGGNLGDRAANLAEASRRLNLQVGRVLASSALYETAAWGREEDPAYLNQVLEIDSDLEPRALLQACLEIEEAMGRIRSEKWAARHVDIDLLFYGNRCIDEPGLHVPHPRLAQRRFVLEPLCELVPEFIDPRSGLAVRELLRRCPDSLPVRRLA